ncbi:helix-turn-helix domain-containing protein [Cupriavidus sp. 2MCAB6]|uniref:helix-turn-helix domain-containing protein n=1 Tax=Cupriavidus sp. 2MCAB6 TaxID=3232981 RepID=UPI003F90033C
MANAHHGANGTSSLPLIDVAARAGFQTQQHFTEVFHRYARCTPQAFRHRPTIG